MWRPLFAYYIVIILILSLTASFIHLFGVGGLRGHKHRDLRLEFMWGWGGLDLDLRVGWCRRRGLEVMLIGIFLIFSRGRVRLFWDRVFRWVVVICTWFRRGGAWQRVKLYPDLKVGRSRLGIILFIIFWLFCWQRVARTWRMLIVRVCCWVIIWLFLLGFFGWGGCLVWGNFGNVCNVVWRFIFLGGDLYLLWIVWRDSFWDPWVIIWWVILWIFVLLFLI